MIRSLFKCALWLMILLGCATEKPIAGVVRAPAGEPLKSIPGPMPGFGPFKSHTEAILKACPLLLGLPHARAGRRSDPNFELYFRLSTEYCAWIYHTPAGNYEMSWVATDASQNESSRRRCGLPSFVDDARYSPDMVRYVYAVHSHPYDGRLTNADILRIVEETAIHGAHAVIEGREVRLGAIAYFSKTLEASCDGFYEYFPATGMMHRWEKGDGEAWHRKRLRQGDGDRGRC